ncbi:MAG: transposase [Polyangiaceae bacterium]|nr:transposase [Polyangiaceae bacterium]
MWAYSGRGLVAFHYTPNWKADGPAEFFDGFRVYLQGDGYAGYEKALRDAMDGDTGDRSGRASSRLRDAHSAQIRGSCEARRCPSGRGDWISSRRSTTSKREYKEHKLSSEDRLAQRTLGSVPLVDELYQWIRDVKPQAIPENTALRCGAVR